MGPPLAEFAFICGKEYAERNYAILFKKYATGESVLLDINMSSIGRYFNAFQSGNTDIRLLKQAQEKHGEDFLEAYLDMPR